MGAVFVGSQDGTVYAFDLETGCVRWTFAARAEVRTGITLGKRGPDKAPTAYFGDIIANLYAIDAETGELIWQTSADDHHSATLTGTPAFAEGNLYVPCLSLEVVTAADPDYACCTFRGMFWQSIAKMGVSFGIATPSPTPLFLSQRPVPGQKYSRPLAPPSGQARPLMSPEIS